MLFVTLTLAPPPSYRQIDVNLDRVLTIRRVSASEETMYMPSLPERTAIYFGRFGGEYDALDTVEVTETPAEIRRLVTLAGLETRT